MKVWSLGQHELHNKRNISHSYLEVGKVFYKRKLLPKDRNIGKSLILGWPLQIYRHKLQKFLVTPISFKIIPAFGFLLGVRYGETMFEKWPSAVTT